MSTSLRYAIVSPVKDEEEHIELTLRSVVGQTVQPAAWVIVDDGSSDRTAEIVRAFAGTHAFIQLVTSSHGKARQTGTAEAQAFKRGVALLCDTDYDFIVKLDGDLSFDADYFERLFRRFSNDEKLGIASGVYLETDSTGIWKAVAMPSYHAFGACKVVRRRCFEEIEGFLTTPGWDTVDEIRAMNLGWRTGHFADLEVKHHKREGSAMGPLTTSVMHGEIYYLTGGDPLFMALKFLRRLGEPPAIVNALALAYGYLGAIVRGRERLVTAAEARYYRRLLRQRIWGRDIGRLVAPTNRSAT